MCNLFIDEKKKLNRKVHKVFTKSKNQIIIQMGGPKNIINFEVINNGTIFLCLLMRVKKRV